MKSKTKSQKVIEHLLSGKSLTKLDCFKLFGYWNLGDIIYKLRTGKINGKYYDINTTMKKTIHGDEYAEYIIN